MKTGKYYLGIDAGGTTTNFTALRLDGKTVEDLIYNGCQFSVLGLKRFTDKAVEYIFDFMKKNSISIESCNGICIAAAGLRYAADKERVEKSLIKKLGIRNITAEGDSAAALFSAFGEKDGAILICGTGSILFGRVNNQLIRIGGWGRIIDDRGSGYRIGVLALKKVCSDYDNNRISEFTMLIEETFEINQNNVLSRIYADKLNISEIAEKVIVAADHGNETAIKILDNAAAELMELLNSFRKTYRVKLPLCLSGGLLNNSNYFSEKISNTLIDKFKRNFELNKKEINPSLGAAYIAFNKFNNSK